MTGDLQFKIVVNHLLINLMKKIKDRGKVSLIMTIIGTK